MTILRRLLDGGSRQLHELDRQPVELAPLQLDPGGEILQRGVDILPCSICFGGIGGGSRLGAGLRF